MTDFTDPVSIVTLDVFRREEAHAVDVIVGGCSSSVGSVDQRNKMHVASGRSLTGLEPAKGRR